MPTAGQFRSATNLCPTAVGWPRIRTLRNSPRAAGVAPFTLLSCDIPGNGHTLGNAVAGLARLSDPEFGDWISANVAFPNSMVDRITPATGAREIDHCRETFGIEDNWPVYCEEFKQWVLEDKFTAGRPALEKVGVMFVEDWGLTN